METSYKHSWSSHTYEYHKADRCPSKGKGHRQSTPLCWAIQPLSLQQILKILHTSPKVFKSFVEEGQENTPCQHHTCCLILFIYKDQTKLLFAFNALTQLKASLAAFPWHLVLPCCHFSGRNCCCIWIFACREARKKGFLQLQTSCRILLTYSFYVQKHTVRLSLQSPLLQSQYLYLN